MFYKPAAAVTLVKMTSKTLGCDLPDGFVAATVKAAALIAAAERLNDGTGTRLHQAVLEALSNGKDLHADPAVAAALFDFQLSTCGVAGAAQNRADIDIAEALTEYADDMMTGWSLAAQPHLDALADAAQSGLPDNLDDTRSISNRGATAMAHWSSAQTALRVTDAACKGITQLTTAAHVSVTRDRRPLLFTTASLDQLNQAIRDTGREVDVWTAAQAGLKLGLVASIGELIERLATYSQQIQQAIDAEQQRQAHPRKAHV